MSKICLLFLLFLIEFPFVFAEDIVMSVEQSQYYFKIGENAVIPLEIQNNFNQQISGMLQYTITQQIRQANTQFSSSNTQASMFTVNEGTQIVSLDFGTSTSPAILSVNLNFIYNDGNQMNVSFDPITIHFVTDESQKNNVQNKMQSSSQQGASAQNNPSSTQQSLQQKLDQIMNQPSPIAQDPQQRLQNNQLAQDSNALKKEIQEQLQEENSLKKTFENQLASAKDFQKSHHELLKQGYNVTGGNLNPSSDSTGDFEVNYQNEQGKWAKIEGSMINGTITKIQKQTQEEQEGLLAKLRADPTFQDYENQLIQDTFVEQNLEFIFDQNMTSISLVYKNDETQTATIVADFKNDELVNIQLEKPWKDYSHLYPLLILVPAGIIAYFLYEKLKIKKKIPSKPPISKESKKFDYVLESNNLLIEAKDNFNKKQYKDAYGKVSQAIRLFLSYELKLNKEITNEDLISHLENSVYPISDIRYCFQLSSLVEFAKLDATDEDFNKMISIAQQLFHRKHNNLKK
ncbi:hypothetical protein C6990_01265 [Nitrosopumilus sp. b3]|uniref:hypothetical protein n=1 Tax=Nitrosopumilus sp. b3 TaxID=2109909 RepID=UPI0015F5592B|nr:hypothetical protein [Nitrosopumilus sp. b3]KAF6248097.1 hypothetical protein C6990_01265 [Nitrosopumilus sp. b3]